jgi:TatD DNase family protein
VRAGPVPEGETIRGRPPVAVDTHCHLFLMEQDPAAAVAEAREAGVARLVCVGIDPASSRRSLELAESFQGVFATAGVHPHTASQLDREAGSAVEELLAHPMVVGVGETGLDYFRRLSPVEDQRRAFRTHVALSRETGKPLVVHVRDAWEDAMAILGEEGAERVVLHCFSGDEAVAAEAASRGYFLSFSANVTYPGADGIRRAVAAVGEDRILTETDSPFLPPQSSRGTPNTPANVIAVARRIAEVRGTDPDAVVAHTAASAAAAFSLPA